MSLYTAVFQDVAVTAIQDLFAIVAPATGVVAAHDLHISQRTDVGDANEEILRLQLTRGYTTSGSGGTVVTAAPIHPSDQAFGGTVRANDTVQASLGTPVTIGAWTFNIRAGFDKIWTPETRPIIAPSGRLVVELPVAPNSSLTMSGTMTFETIG